MFRKRMAAWICTAALCFSAASAVPAAENADMINAMGEELVLDPGAATDADDQEQGLNAVVDEDAINDSTDFSDKNGEDDTAADEVVFVDDTVEDAISGEELPMDGIDAEEGDALIFEPQALIEEIESDPEAVLVPKSYGDLNEPTIGADQKVTYSCVWLGSYPQSEVPKDSALYQTLEGLTGWENNDIEYNGHKYRRMTKADATYQYSYSWDDSTHYFVYEPIKWRVLGFNSTGREAILLADIVLDDQRFDANETYQTWNNCTLRTWLNNTFYNRAFNLNEQGAVNYYDSTDDKVVLLSDADVKNTQYGFAADSSTEDAARLGKCSTFANAMGTQIFPTGYCVWWLRSKGASSYDAKTVDDDGTVFDSGYSVISPECGVRPALSLKLQSDFWSYAGTVCSDGTESEVPFKVLMQNCSIDEIADLTYNGTNQKPPVTVRYLGKTLQWGSDYYVTYRNNQDVGKAEATVNGIGDFSRSKQVQFMIRTLPLDNCTVSSIEDVTYSGKPQRPSVTVTYDGHTLEEGKAYTVAYSSNTDAGAARVTISGIEDNCSGSRIQTFQILQQSLANCTISSIADVPYSGTKQEPDVTVTNQGTTLTAGTDYTVSYSDNIEAGIATVKVTGMGNYTGEKTSTFRIVMPLDNCTISQIDDVIYNGKAQRPPVEVKCQEKTLTEGTDYTVTYSDNVNVGTATVTVTGKGIYTGEKTATFQIVVSMADCTVSPIADVPYSGTEEKPPVEVKYQGAALTDGTDYTVIYSDNIEPGTATVKVTGMGNYTGEKTATFRIVIPLDACKISEIEKVTYTGKAQRPSVDVTYEGKALIEHTDYAVTYSNNVNVGTAQATVIGKGNYTGEATISFEIIAPVKPEPTPTPTPDPQPKPTPENPVDPDEEVVTISKKVTGLKAAPYKTSVTATWKAFKKNAKTKAIRKIEVQISTDKSFSTIVKVKKVGKKTRAVIKGLKSKTTYYVRARYLDGNGGVSNWSKVKKFKTR